MYKHNVTFGHRIAEARKQANLSQKELANLVRKEEDGQPISPQYLNDIERDRRNAPPTFLIDQFAKVLAIPADVLYFLAKELPPDIKSMPADEETVLNAFKAFRRELKQEK